MTLAQYLPVDYSPGLSGMWVDRIIFGTDFPNFSYAWDREIKNLVGLDLPPKTLAKIIGENACEFYSIENPVLPG